MKKNKRTNNTDSDEKILDDNTENDVHEADVSEEPEISRLEEENQKLRDTLLRKAAEFENYKKRTAAEYASIISNASERIIKELLPVYDDMQRSIESIRKGETKDFETLKTGMEMIHEKFKNVLEKEGLEEINSLGKEFDVNLSTALMKMPKEGVEPDTVVEVLEKGYKLNDKVLRHEKVFVSGE
jgi:molecular chaperone GrpE